MSVQPNYTFSVEAGHKSIPMEVGKEHSVGVLCGKDGKVKEVVQIKEGQFTVDVMDGDMLYIGQEKVAQVFSNQQSGTPLAQPVAQGSGTPLAQSASQAIRDRISLLKSNKRFKGSYLNLLGRVNHYIANSSLRAEIRWLKALAKAPLTDNEKSLQLKIKEYQGTIKSLVQKISSGVAQGIIQKLKNPRTEVLQLDADNKEKVYEYFGIGNQLSYSSLITIETLTPFIKLHKELVQAQQDLQKLQDKTTP